jgi:hypothetical protein
VLPEFAMLRRYFSLCIRTRGTCSEGTKGKGKKKSEARIEERNEA